MGQITFDGSIGGPAGSLSGPNFQIPHTRGEIAGGNLFHSFSTFDLGRGQSATFTGPASVDNILARVTGGPSTIQGTVRSGIQGASLFLINPAGIVFGQGAQIDVTGAFRATTADFIELADGRRFMATPDGSVALLSAAPESFGFLSGSAHVGTLRVEAPVPGGGVVSSGLNGKGQDVAMVGRQVEIVNSYLKSAGGTISLTAVGGGAASVALDPPPREAVLDASLAGDVSITGSAVSVSGASGGEILVRGGRIVIDGAGTGFVQSGTQFDTFSGIDADAKSAGGGGEIRIDSAGDIVLRNNARVASFARNSLDGGSIGFRAGGAMRLESGADVVASTTAAGNGGTIRIGAASLTIDGTGATRATRLSAQSNATATGAAGSIEVEVDGLLELKEGGSIVTNTFSRGAGGSIRIEAGSLTAFQGSDPRYTGVASSTSVPASPSLLAGYGNAGSLTVDVAGRIELRDSATIESTSASDGNGGSVLVRGGSLYIEGAEQLGRPDRNEFLTGILGLTTLRGTGALGDGVRGGRGGDVRVEVAGEIMLVGGGQIDTSSFGGGDSGEVNVSAKAIIADRAGSNFFTGIASDTEAWDDRGRPDAKWAVTGGRAGTVTVTATESIQLLNGANISSSTAGSGDAGDVVVTAPSIFISGSGSDEVYTPGPQSGIVALSETGRTDDAGYVTPPATGNAGSVRVTLPGPGLLEITRDGKISAESQGTGAGGSVEITAEGGSVRVSDEGKISARSELSGDAGRVSVVAGEILISTGGIVESLNSGSGVAGGVDLEAAGITLRGGTISVDSQDARAGDIRLSAAGRLRLAGGRIVADSGGDGGDIVLQAGRFLYGTRSVLTARARGDGGNLSIRGPQVIFDGGTIGADAVDGDGGAINISSIVYFANGVVPTADSENGTDGSVVIDAQVSFQGNEEGNEAEFLNPDDALQPDCTQRAASDASSFIRAGRGGTRRLPGGYLPSFRLIE
jgi:filamentous hemagglutinin family protein